MSRPTRRSLARWPSPPTARRMRIASGSTRFPRCREQKSPNEPGPAPAQVSRLRRARAGSSRPDRAVRAAMANLEEARTRSAAEEPALKEELEEAGTELAEVEAERDKVWAEVPPAAQAAYSRTRAQPPVARVVGNQCTACRVTVTSSGMQTLRKGLDDLVHCQHYGRILVLA